MSIEAFEFRQADPSELEELTLVLERANAQRDGMSLPTSLEGDVQAIEAMRLRMDRIEARAYVATFGEKIVGFSLSHPVVNKESANADEDSEHLSLLMVDPDYWGKRIASRLLDITAEHARDNGRCRLTLWTRKANNYRAQDVYTHKGFILSGVERPSEYGLQVQYQLDL